MDDSPRFYERSDEADPDGLARLTAAKRDSVQ
jgi:hypothetical protein